MPDMIGCETVRVLFAGGCHVGGFPVGEELGFSYTAMELLRAKFPSQSFEAKTLLYVNLATADRIITACREYGPHIVVLQVGHYESSIPLGKRIRHLLQRRPSLASKTQSGDVIKWTPDYQPTQLHFSDSWNRRAKSAGKVTLDCVLRAMGQPSFDASVLRRRLSHLINGLRCAGFQHQLLLSPFPCIDATISMYRKQEKRIFISEARKAGIEFVDVTAIVDNRCSSQEETQIFADDRHLSVEGHRATGMLVASVLSATLANIAVPVVETSVPF